MQSNPKGRDEGRWVGGCDFNRRHSFTLLRFGTGRDHAGNGWDQVGPHVMIGGIQLTMAIGGNDIVV